MSKIIDAVSIVMTCGDEIFAIKRQHFLRAFPGYWAFPGGKVESDDSAFSILHPITENLDPRLLGAAVREGQEELGIDLREEVKSGNIERIDYLGLAITPDFNPYRFATYFFRFNFKSKIPFQVDRNEAMIAHWIRAAELLKLYDDGQLLAVPPVIRVIETLGRHPDIRHIEDLNLTFDTERFVPYIENLKGMRQLMPLSNTLPPANRTNAFLIGDEGSPKTLVDPSPANREEYQKLKNTVDLFGIDQVLITHHHPDHHEHAIDLSKDYGIPVLLSSYTQERLMKSHPSYFSGVETKLLKEGDKVTKWLGRDVMVYEVPGHDEGQLALAPTDLSWFLAGDLFQGVGTVVVGDEEGDMAKYFATLERIIVMNPKVLFPSHGIGLGGVTILEKTLEHRRTRENQVLVMHQKGYSPQKMLEEIYAEVPQKLWPYAMKNIEKHLEKLRNEKKI